MVEQLAISEGHKATAELERGMDAARTLAHALGQLKVAGLANRANADALLKPIFGGKKQVTMFEMAGLLSKHLS